uniref:Integrase catalytic domain-containing protein n=1 Tax=Cuerna arida TaxID=1464854 RepID=A0A1B6FHG3_9HEMI
MGQRSNPWERIHVDYAGPTDGQQYLIVVDAFTRWNEVVPTCTATTTWKVNKLRKLFSTFVFPYAIVLDYGTQFSSQEFCKFTRKQHRTIPTQMDKWKDTSRH